MELPLLMALRVQGISPAHRAAVACGCSPDEAADALASLAEGELATERGTRGFTLTPKGRDALDKLLADEGLRTNEELQECYERFMTLNARILKASTDWQVRSDAPNDHSDPHYDDEVIDRLAQIHSRAKTCIEKMPGRFSQYAVRLDDCIVRLQKGDRSAFTAPLAESYHTVWFELHQDLLLTLGLKREE